MKIRTKAVDIKPFTYQVHADVFQKPQREKKIKPTKIDKYFEIYDILKEQSNNMIPKQEVIRKPRQVKMFNPLERKRQQKLKQLQDQAFERKKKQLLIDNKVRLTDDINNLEKISKTAYNQFNGQVNLYNKYYSNYIGDELNLNEVNYEDLNIDTSVIKDNLPRYTYRTILRTSGSDLNLNNKRAAELTQEIHRYTMTQEQLDMPQLRRTQTLISIPKPTADELILFKVVRDNDIQTLRSFLSANKQMINARDPSGQTLLHWAAKRDYIQIAIELMQQGVDLQAKDIAGRTAKMIAQKFQRFKMAKIIQIEEQQQTHYKVCCIYLIFWPKLCQDTANQNLQQVQQKLQVT